MDTRKGDTRELLEDHDVMHDVISKPARPWLPLAVLVTLCCCSPIGLVGLIAACDAKFENEMGNYRAAHKLSRRARMMSMLSLGIGLVVLILIIVYLVVLYNMITKYGAAIMSAVALPPGMADPRMQQMSPPNNPGQ